MFSILTAVVLTLTVLFGGAGATVYAAQSSMPDEALYPLKTISEDLRLNLAVDPEAQIKLLLNYADERVGEMAKLLDQGEPVASRSAISLHEADGQCDADCRRAECREHAQKHG